MSQSITSPEQNYFSRFAMRFPIRLFGFPDKLPDDCMTSAIQLPKDCMVNASQLSDKLQITMTV